jgi:hypothetical protein
MANTMTNNDIIKYLNDTDFDHETRETYNNILAEVLKDLKSDNTKIHEFMAYVYRNWLPDYFFTTPASSTGKYHPACSNLKNGLLLHSLLVEKFTLELLELTDYDTHKRNLMLIAAFIHDIFKYGNPYTYNTGDYTCFEHPQIAADFLLNENVIKKGAEFDLTEEDFKFLSSIIASHMGPWNKSKYSNVELDVPKSQEQILLHKADYFASMKEGALIRNFIQTT